MSQSATYWTNNGKHQAEANALEALCLAESSGTPFTEADENLLALFRVTCTAYCELKNNEFMNAQLVLPQLLEALEAVEGQSAFVVPEVCDAVHDLREYHAEFMRIENGDYEFDEDEYEDDIYPDATAMHPVMETLLDTVVTYAHGNITPSQLKAS